MKDKLKRAIEIVCENFGGQLTATDTHRWVDSDGFYEVQFMIKFPKSPDYEQYESGIYIHNISGDQDLEDEWSANNPQLVSFNQFEDHLDDEFDCKWAIGDIKKYLTEKKILPTEELQQIIDSINIE